MRPRFLIAVAQDAALIDAIQARARTCLSDHRECRTAMKRGSLLVITSGAGPIAIGEAGLLIGPAFMRGSPRQLSGLDLRDQEAIVGTRGAWLINACWGGYVAVIADPEGAVDIVRAPLGDLACYCVRLADAFLCASDLALLVAGRMTTPSLDPPALARHLAADDIRRPETCIIDVSELPGGERVTIADGNIARQSMWSPWTFAGRDRQIADPDEAARRLHDTALHCVDARAGEFGPALLKLSGGLDSSIVAACLAATGRSFSCLTLVTHDPAGDERGYAGLVAEALGVPLAQRYRDVSKVAPARSAAARLPRPTVRSFAQESARLAAEVALEAGAGVVFDGGGGDNIFCSLQSVRPAADCLMDEAGSGRFWPTARSIAQLAQASLWTVALRAWRTSRRRSPHYAWPLDLRFLSAEARQASVGATAHPWLDAPSGTLPGKAAHVALITAAQSVAEGYDAQDDLVTCSPLISQPLVEVCLRIPSWLWFEDGLNRAVARRAFSARLPAGTVRRRSKGAPDSFIAQIYEANKADIRAMLMDGVLRRHGLLDMAALSDTLEDRRPVRGHDFLRIMQLSDAEAWARCWC